MHEVMHVSKVGAVGDIQSNYSALIESLEKAKFIEIRQGSPVWMAGQSALVFTGDLVDGGAEPGELLCFIPILYRAIQEHKGVLVLIKGNHDEMMLQTFSPFLKKNFPIEEFNKNQYSLQQLRIWMSKDGDQTLLEMARFKNIELSEMEREKIKTADQQEVAFPSEFLLSAIQKIVAAYRKEILFLFENMRAAALINGRILAFHGAPNFAAQSLNDFITEDFEKSREGVLWGRQWLNHPDLEENLKRLVSSLGGTIQGLIFGHTPQSMFRVSSIKGQCKIGRVVARDLARGIPALYNLMTAPRAVSQEGGIGILIFDQNNVRALYTTAEIAGSCEVILDSIPLALE